MGDSKWLLYNNVGRARLWGKQKPPHQPRQGWSYPEEVTLYVWWGQMAGEPSTVSPPSGNPDSHSDKHCSQQGQLKATLDEKHPELAENMTFHQDNLGPMIL